MRIKSNLKIRSIAGENIVMLRSNDPEKGSKLLVLNETSVFLWKSLEGKDFSIQDVADLLLGHFKIEKSKAMEDSAEWISKMEEAGAVE